MLTPLKKVESIKSIKAVDDTKLDIRRSKEIARLSGEFRQTHGNNLRRSKEEPLRTSKDLDIPITYQVDSRSVENP